MPEIFEPELYLLNEKSNEQKINRYNSCFKNGILLHPKILYFLLKGSYVDDDSTKMNNFSFEEVERVSYKSINRLLNKIKGDIGDYTIWITPHIFTKFVHELREGVKDKEHFGNILNLFKNNFDYIKEEELKKEDIIRFKHFSNRYCGISETALILLKDKIKNVCIIDYSGKGKEWKIYDVGGKDYLYVDFLTLVIMINEYERRETIK